MQSDEYQMSTLRPKSDEDEYNYKIYVGSGQKSWDWGPMEIRLSFREWRPIEWYSLQGIAFQGVRNVLTPEFQKFAR
jgi:hypothetical protein